MIQFAVDERKRLFDLAFAHGHQVTVRAQQGFLLRRCAGAICNQLCIALHLAHRHR
jgi:hypothetical protein